MKNNYEINKQMTFDRMRSIEIGSSKREISNRSNAVKHMRIDCTSFIERHKFNICTGYEEYGKRPALLSSGAKEEIEIVGDFTAVNRGFGERKPCGRFRHIFSL